MPIKSTFLQSPINNEIDFLADWDGSKATQFY